MRGDLIETYKICNGRVKYGKERIFLSSYTSPQSTLKEKSGSKFLAIQVANYQNKLLGKVTIIR